MRSGHIMSILAMSFVDRVCVTRKGGSEGGGWMHPVMVFLPIMKKQLPYFVGLHFQHSRPFYSYARLALSESLSN